MKTVPARESNPDLVEIIVIGASWIVDVTERRNIQPSRIITTVILDSIIGVTAEKIMNFISKGFNMRAKKNTVNNRLVIEFNRARVHVRE
jgi:hypothetical protein